MMDDSDVLERYRILIAYIKAKIALLEFEAELAEAERSNKEKGNQD